jgi:hypothetical protein
MLLAASAPGRTVVVGARSVAGVAGNLRAGRAPRGLRDLLSYLKT